MSMDLIRIIGCATFVVLYYFLVKALFKIWDGDDHDHRY